MVGTAKLRKLEHENKTGEKWEQGDRHLAPFSQITRLCFHVPFTFVSSSLSDSLEQAK